MVANTKTLAVVGSPLAAMSERLGIEARELEAVIKATVMPAKDAHKNPLVVTNELFVAFLAVANNYQLDPLKKEIYAFPAKGGGIQAVVSIDGWMSIINAHPQFDGMELVENDDSAGTFVSVTCTIYRKDREHPTVVTEWLSECKQSTDPWRDRPRRMLRHKTAIQCSRYAFGLGGIVEHDEAIEALGGEREVAPAVASEPEEVFYPVALFDSNLPKWRVLIESGKRTPAEVIATVQSKGSLTEKQKVAISNCAPVEGEIV